MVQNLLHHIAGHVDGHRKTNSLVSAGAVRKDGGVNANEFAAIVNERAAGISGIDGSVSLDEIFIILDTQISAIHGADNSHGYGLTNSKRIANREGIVTNLYLRGVANRDSRIVVALYLE